VSVIGCYDGGWSGQKSHTGDDLAELLERAVVLDNAVDAAILSRAGEKSNMCGCGVQPHLEDLGHRLCFRGVRRAGVGALDVDDAGAALLQGVDFVQVAAVRYDDAGAGQVDGVQLLQVSGRRA